MASGTISIVSGSQSLTGTFAVITALGDSDVSISGSLVGSLRFDMKAGTQFFALHTDTTNKSTFTENAITLVRVNNANGRVLAQQVAVD
jgi:hypothetical protein